MKIDRNERKMYISKERAQIREVYENDPIMIETFLLFYKLKFTTFVYKIHI